MSIEVLVEVNITAMSPQKYAGQVFMLLDPVNSVTIAGALYEDYKAKTLGVGDRFIYQEDD